MKIKKILTAIALWVLATLASHAYAEVYKCTSTNNASGQKTIVYSDIPCQTSASGQAVSQRKVEITDYAIAQPSATDADVDLQISRAVLNGDFKLAKTLAHTKEHWRLISMAEGQRVEPAKLAVPPVVIVKDTSTNDCAMARSDFESTSRTHWRQKDLIAAKRSSMFAACGVAEPAQQNSPVVIGQSYGGIQSSRWFAPAYRPKVYRHAYHQHYKKHHPRHSQNKSGLSLHYQSKHFGVRAQSFATQKHSDIRQQFGEHRIRPQNHDGIRQQFR